MQQCQIFCRTPLDAWPPSSQVYATVVDRWDQCISPSMTNCAKQDAQGSTCLAGAGTCWVNLYTRNLRMSIVSSEVEPSIIAASACSINGCSLFKGVVMKIGAVPVYLQWP